MDLVSCESELKMSGYLHILENGKIKKKYFKLIGREIYRKLILTNLLIQI